MPERAGTHHDDPMQSKGSIFRGFVATLEREGLLEQVRARVSEETRALIDSPPPASSWMPSWPSEEIAEAAASLVGLARWRRIAYAAARDGVIPLLRVAVEGFLRVFGATPATVFARLQQLTQSSTRGVEYEYTPTGPQSGEMVVRYPHRRDLPMSTYVAVSGSLEVAFELCGARGTIDDPEPLPVPLRNAARLRVRW